MIRPCKRIAQLLLESLDLKRWTRIGAMNKNAAGARTTRPRVPSSRFARTRRPRSAGWLMQRSQSDTPAPYRCGLPRKLRWLRANGLKASPGWRSR